MFDYTYDAETGGILLNDRVALMSKEPRPVYALELTYLGVNQFYDFEMQQEVPYMWAEANHYIYKGQRIFDTKGGSLYVKPEVVLLCNDKGENVLPVGTKLDKININAMNIKNRDMLEVIEQSTVKKIYAAYKKYKKKVDCFHVALSGGKDSIVLLDLTKKALPADSFMVVFGDTKMEFPDTYDVIDKLEEECKAEGIAFYRAASHFDPEESWRLFGPPSRVLRWCCTVHKSTPQTLKIREVLGKNDYVGLDFVGVRAHESATRAEYEQENFGKKQKGQYSFNSILEWTSAEIWTYIFSRNLIVNETYKKGNSRAGCLFCPMGGGKGDSFQYLSYGKEMDKFIDIIKSCNLRDEGNPKSLESYITNGGWNARKNGRDLRVSQENYIEETINGVIKIKVNEPKTSYHEWIKTLGDLYFDYSVEETDVGYIVTVDDSVFIGNPTLKRKFKQVFKKSAYCVGCRVCEVNCRNGCISFEDGLHIDKCLHCGQCHEIDNGCLVYNSLKMPLGGTKKMNSYNSFANHAPKSEWIDEFLCVGNDFWDNNTLGPNQVPMFKKFLRESGIIDSNNKTSKLFDKLKDGVNEAWGIALVNFAYNSQCSWYINNMPFDETMDRNVIAEMLINDGVSKDDSTSIINAYRRFSEMQFGTLLNYMSITTKGRNITTLTRNKCTSVDDRVILYCLYKYAEACDGYYELSLPTLLDINSGSAGISPIKIFGHSRDEMEIILRGLSAKYNDYIDVSFTHNLEKINLRDYHKSDEIIDLF